MPSLVVTLAMLYIVRGVDAKLVNGHIVLPSQVPSAFAAVGYRTILGIPWLAIIVAVVVVVVGYAMRTFRSCRDLYAIGSNPEAATLAGDAQRPAGVHWPSSPAAPWRASAARCSWRCSRRSTTAPGSATSST